MDSDLLNLPNFLVIGAQRSGTTWLYQMLRHHPRVFVPEKKETEFFAHRRIFDRLGIEGYSRQHFSAADPAQYQAIGEASPSYLWTSNDYSDWCNKPNGFIDNIPELVRDHLTPELKLIVTLRNPVNRAISAFCHHLKKGRVEIGDSILDVGGTSGIIHLGFYAAHLEQWFDYFDRSQFLILLFEETITNPRRAIKSLYSFLNVDDRFKPWNFRKRYNQTYHFEDEHGNTSFLTKQGRTLITTAHEMHELRHIFRDDIQRLSGLLGRDLETLWLTGSD